MGSSADARISISRTPLWRRQQFWRIVLPTLAVACAVGAAVLVYNAFVGSSGVSQSKTGWGVTYPEPKKPKTVPLAPEAKAVARRFVQTAVARKNLREAYAFSGPAIREGMTLKQWLTGNIAVVPYTVNDATSARMAVDESYAKSAKLELLLDTPKHKPALFFMDLVKKKGKWFVNSWVPRASIPIPKNQ
jgi:hypothetical protein